MANIRTRRTCRQPIPTGQLLKFNGVFTQTTDFFSDIVFDGGANGVQIETLTKARNQRLAAERTDSAMRGDLYSFRAHGNQAHATRRR